MTARPTQRQMAKHVRHQRRRVCQAPDDGSALVLVLVLLTILALALGAMFAEAGANLNTSTVVAGQDNKVYAADGGVEIAIHQLRANPTLCKTSMSLDPKTTIDGLTINLTCGPTASANGQVTIHSKALPPAGDPGQSAITSTAVVSIGTDPSKTVNIVSWVTVGQ